jgi:hypothetical protein
MDGMGWYAVAAAVVVVVVVLAWRRRRFRRSRPLVEHGSWGGVEEFQRAMRAIAPDDHDDREHRELPEPDDG